jgi:hypothetical protein
MAVPDFGIASLVLLAFSVFHFSVVIFFWSFGIIDASTFKCWALSTAQAGARGLGRCCTYSLSLMYRLNQTESAIFKISAAEGSLCLQILVRQIGYSPFGSCWSYTHHSYGMLPYRQCSKSQSMQLQVRHGVRICDGSLKDLSNTILRNNLKIQARNCSFFWCLSSLSMLISLPNIKAYHDSMCYMCILKVPW